MAKFTDNKNRTWEIKLDGVVIRELRKSLKVNLIDERGECMQRLAREPALLVDVLWHLCHQQSSEITTIEFAAGLIGDAIENAAHALISAVVEFSPQRKQALLKSIVDFGVPFKAQALNG